MQLLKLHFNLHLNLKPSIQLEASDMQWKVFAVTRVIEMAFIF